MQCTVAGVLHVVVRVRDGPAGVEKAAADSTRRPAAEVWSPAVAGILEGSPLVILRIKHVRSEPCFRKESAVVGSLEVPLSATFSASCRK